MSWRTETKWDILRYLVYYQIENFIPKSLIENKTIVDFSCGLGDLSEYIAQHSPKKLISTSLDSEIPKPIEENLTIDFRSNVNASNIESTFEENSIDVFLARMVFQFPTTEGDGIDVDDILKQVNKVLKPGGRLIMSSHQFFLADTMLKEELVEVLGIPPREGELGDTGYGLKPLMLMNSFAKNGFMVEECSVIEHFTFPRGLSSMYQEPCKGDEQYSEFIELTAKYYSKLAEKVFNRKKELFATEEYQNIYTRPVVLKKLYDSVSRYRQFTSIPIQHFIVKKL